MIRVLSPGTLTAVTEASKGIIISQRLLQGPNGVAGFPFIPANNIMVKLCTNEWIQRKYINAQYFLILIIPFAWWNIFLEGKHLERVFRPMFAEDVKEVGLPRLKGPACHLQVVIAKGDRLCLLPLVVKHVDRGLIQR